MNPRLLEIQREFCSCSQKLSELCDEAAAILRTSAGVSSVPKPLPFECLPHNVVIRSGVSYSFTPMTYELLKHFAKAKNLFLSKEDVRQDVCCNDDAKNNTVDVCIMRARKEIAANDFPFEIETVRAKGYRLCALSET